MSLLRLAALHLPFGYVTYTRLRPEPARFVQLLVMEWLPAVAVLFFLGERTLAQAAVTFLWGYGAFITVYELGYLFNDVLAYKEGDGARTRLGPQPPAVGAVVSAVIVRLAIFVGLTVLLAQEGRAEWWGFYGALTVTFTLHNTLRDPGLRSVTFVHLALARFFAPLFAFASGAVQVALMGPVILNYVIPRLLGYLESKGLLTLEGRARTGFKVRYHLVLLGPSSLLALAAGSWLPLVVNAYYLAWWSLAALVGFGRDRPSSHSVRA